MEKEFLNQRELCEFLGVSRFAIWNLQKKDDFPKPFTVLNSKKWRKSEIEAYLEKTRKSFPEEQSDV